MKWQGLNFPDAFELIGTSNTITHDRAGGLRVLLATPLGWSKISAVASFCKWCQPHLDGAGSNADASPVRGETPQKQGVRTLPRSQR